jgi:hypothetical protein
MLRFIAILSRVGHRNPPQPRVFVKARPEQARPELKSVHKSSARDYKRPRPGQVDDKVLRRH